MGRPRNTVGIDVPGRKEKLEKQRVATRKTRKRQKARVSHRVPLVRYNEDNCNYDDASPIVTVQETMLALSMVTTQSDKLNVMINKMDILKWTMETSHNLHWNGHSFTSTGTEPIQADFLYLKLKGGGFSRKWVSVRKSTVIDNSSDPATKQRGLFTERTVKKEEIIGYYCGREESRSKINSKKLYTMGCIDAGGGIGKEFTRGMGMHFINDPTYGITNLNDIELAKCKVNVMFMTNGAVISTKGIRPGEELLALYDRRM